MLAFMAWLVLLQLPYHTRPHKYVCCWSPTDHKTLTIIVWLSFALLCHHHLYFAGRIPRRTLNDSMTLCWNSWMIRRRRMKSTTYWAGGTGRFTANYLVSLVLMLVHSQVFPNYITRERAVTKMSALARLKEKRAEKLAQNIGRPSS